VAAIILSDTLMSKHFRIMGIEKATPIRYKQGLSPKQQNIAGHSKTKKVSL
jgi:hypothetical protein